ncbi:hypothetical protein BGV46_19685 [Serratia marcescens]|nr:hypothetical protein RN42_08165 [Serratia marcescens]OHT41636.1 hypothetical protein BGV45_19460 [Serratia marcescens]OHT42665.1 hypothetical protein BGV46_19685 [Serratia marcescens]
MSESKPQDGSTVKGYRTLTADDIAQMNDLKDISRNFCEQLDLERTHLSLETVEAGSPEEINRMEACAVWLSPAPRCRKPACGPAVQWPDRTRIANTIGIPPQ